MAKEPFSLKDLGTLKSGILAEEAGFKPFENFSFGKDFTLRPETALSALLPFGDVQILGQAIGKFQTEDASNRLLDRNVPFQQTLKGAGTGGSATQQIINEIKEQKAKDQFSTEPNITRDDIQKYVASKRPELDLAPIQTPLYTKRELAGGGDVSTTTQAYQTQPFAKGSDFRSRGFKSYGQPEVLMTETGEFDAPTGRTFGQAFKSGDLDTEIKSLDQFAEDKINQVNFGTRDEKGNFVGAKGYDPAFARAVTIENQGDSATADTTFICTVLFEMNILPMSIYKYDQRYGQQVNRKIYNGYALWGKPLAERIRKQGLTYKILTPIACAWAEQMAYDLSDGKVGKNRTSIKIGKFLGETICYALGMFIKPKGEKNARTHIRNRQHGTERRTVHGKDGVPKGRGRPRIKRRATN
tara:strand:- start:426 stop:1664 length:1239 start_codon:yes stop_codon:yes gene_type:complete